MSNAEKVSEDVLRTLERIRQAEGLKSEKEAFNFLVSEYEFFPQGHPGSYSGLRIDYSAHLANLRDQRYARTHGLSRFMSIGLPVNYVWRRGVKDIQSQIRAEGAFAGRRMTPLNDQFLGELEFELRMRQQRGNFSERAYEEAAMSLSSVVAESVRLVLPYEVPISEECRRQASIHDYELAPEEAAFVDSLDLPLK